MGVFLDHYLWELDTVGIFISTTQLSPENALTINNLTLTSFEYLLTEDGYHLLPSFDFSFYIEIAGKKAVELSKERLLSFSGHHLLDRFDILESPRNGHLKCIRL